MEIIASFIAALSNFLYSYILIALLIGAGLFFSLRCGFVQLRLFPEALRLIAERNTNQFAV